LRSSTARPSKKLDIQPTDTAAILEDAMGASPYFRSIRVASSWFGLDLSAPHQEEHDVRDSKGLKQSQYREQLPPA
jgi:hypothetical protein